MARFHRSDRVAGELHAALAQLVREEVKDPRVTDVSIIGVDVSRDMSLARVRFLPLGMTGDPEQVRLGLQKASGYLHRRLGRIMQMRSVPRLEFVIDTHHESAVSLIHAIGDAERAEGDEIAEDGEE